MLDGHGRPVRSAEVILFADDPARWIVYAASWRTGIVSDGRFEIDGVLPGRYLVVAFDEPPTSDFRSLQTFDTLRRHAVEIAVSEGEPTELQLVVSSLP